MTYIQAFDKIKEKLDGKAKISQDYDSFAIQVTLTNKDSHGIFYLKYSDGFLDVQPYDYFANDAADITVFSLNGTVVNQGKNITPAQAVKGLPVGTYIIQKFNGNRIESYKVVVK